mmetsp:Transcript_593/g.1899  ORF Transcript_593/g.1899 Transcript_593/m.1899 type:complete len:107 (+) Transcript_593:467-787(+)
MQRGPQVGRSKSPSLLPLTPSGQVEVPIPAPSQVGRSKSPSLLPPKWLHRARQFGSFLCSPEGRADWGKPDHNLSLFEGLAGSACFLTDVTSEDSARAWGFPLYEL